MIFRDLTADEIEVRIQSITSRGDVCKGLQLLLYKDSRTDATILDETVGAANWERKHYECKGNLYCSVGINVNYDKPEKEEKWVWKDDCGAESNMEKEKGEASDAFKRTMSINWGLGRELYTKIFIWVNAEDFNYWDTKQKDKYGNSIFKTNDKFIVEAIKVENKKIIGLSIKNANTNKRVFLLKPQEK
jgi:hypothetical protein